MSLVLVLESDAHIVLASEGRLSCVAHGERHAVGAGYRKVERLACGAGIAAVGPLPFSEHVRGIARQSGPFATYEDLCAMVADAAREAHAGVKLLSSHAHCGAALAGRDAGGKLQLRFFTSADNFQPHSLPRAPGGFGVCCMGIESREDARAALLRWLQAARGNVTPENAAAAMRQIMRELAQSHPATISEEFYCEVVGAEVAQCIAAEGVVAGAVVPGTGLVQIEGVDLAGTQYVRGDPYHSSAVREPATVARTGNTSSASFVTVSQFDIELSPLQASYKAKNLTVSVAGGIRPSNVSGAGSASNVAGAGVDWANPSNALGSDNAYATAAIGAGGGSDYLRIDFSGFSIPGGAVLKGFALTIERSKTGSGDIEDNSIRLHENGTAVGNDKFASGVLWPGPDENAVYGGQGDLWNAGGISVADLNSGIVGCLIQAAETGGVSAATARVDAVTLTVYYDEFVAEARVKIGAQVSSVLSLTGPSTSAGPVDRDVTGLTPGSTITVEVQGRMAAGSGTVTAAIDQKRMTPQHRDHFVV